MKTNDDLFTATVPMIRVATVYLDGHEGYTVPRSESDTVLSEVCAALKEGEWESIEVRLHEMPESEFDAMPEFQGW